MARHLAAALVVVVFGLLVVFEAQALFVLFAGALLAIFLKTAADALARFSHMPYRLAVVEIVLALLGGAVALGISAGPTLAQQTTNLVQAIPAALQHVATYVEQYFGSASPGAPRHPSDLVPAARDILVGAGGAVTSSVELVAAFVVTAFIGFYGALSPRSYARIALVLVPPKQRATARVVLSETVRRLGRWLLGRAVAMAFVGVATCVGLWLLHLPLALALGVLAGMLTFIEFFGPLMSAVPPLLIALAASPGKAVWVLLLFVGVHLVDGYALTPFIARRAVNFPPAYTLALQALFGAVFGALGLTFATPTGIVGVTLVELLWVRDLLGLRAGPQNVSSTARSSVDDSTSSQRVQQ